MLPVYRIMCIRYCLSCLRAYGVEIVFGESREGKCTRIRVYVYSVHYYLVTLVASYLQPTEKRGGDNRREGEEHRYS